MALGGVRGRKDLNRERGEKILGEEKGEDLRRDKALGGKGGKDLNRERGAKDLRGEGGQGVNSKGTQIRKQACNVGGLSRRR